MHRPDFRKEEIILCILRSLSVGVFITITILAMHLVDNAIFITSLAATTFIVFTFPKAQSVKPRFVIGGYVSAALFGIPASLVCVAYEVSYPILILLCALVVFLTTLCMTIFDFEHPPAAAFAISLVLADNAITISVLALICVVVLCIIKKPLAIFMLKISRSFKKNKTI